MILLTVGIPIFIAELTDKDALLLLTLAARFKGWVVFAAGSITFTITSAIIVTAGHFLISYVPVSWVSLAGGAIMLSYGVWSYFHVQPDGEEATNVEKLSAKTSKGMASVFLSIVSLLVLLDLTGDATEVLTILFVARFGDAFIVFVGAVIALIAATALETTIGNRLSRILSVNRLRIFSSLVFLTIGTSAILSVLLHI
jgi:putative Ca2+/H+ antiporter (TMEM165/GDT1 family)